MNSRLTGKIRNFDGSATSIKPIADDKGFPNKFGSDVLTKLADYEDLEEQDRLIKLPCKVGDTVYEITGATKRGYDWKYLTYEKAYVFKTIFTLEKLDYIGKRFFRTKEEAEAKLKELKGE